MPSGKPPLVAPWTRDNWGSLSKSRRLYAIQEYQCSNIRRAFDAHRLRDGSVSSYVKEIPHFIAIQLGISHDYISVKARNLLRKYIPDEDASAGSADANQPTTSQSPVRIDSTDSDDDYIESTPPDSQTIQSSGEDFRNVRSPERKLRELSDEAKRRGAKLNLTDPIGPGINRGSHSTRPGIEPDNVPKREPQDNASGTDDEGTDTASEHAPVEGENPLKQVLCEALDEPDLVCIHMCPKGIHVIINEINA